MHERGAAGLVLALLVGMLGASAVRVAASEEPPQPPAPIALQPGRPDSSRVAGPATLSDLQRRLDSVSAAGASDCLSSYAAHKAQAWLNFASYAAAEQLPALTQAAAQQDAGKLVGALEQHASPALDTPELPGAHHVRDDLWQAIAAVKSDGRMCAAPQMTAYCEVQLAWVDYEAASGGWRLVDPYVRIAEDYCGTAVAAQPAVAPTPAEPEPAPAPPPPEAVSPPVPDESNLVLTVVFPHDRSARADIRPPGRAELKRLSERLSSLPANAVIAVVGHADLTGHTDYNLRLSMQRARSVARELRSLGVRAHITLAAQGSSQPVAQCAPHEARASRRDYLACLEPNRRVFIHLLSDGAGR